MKYSPFCAVLIFWLCLPVGVRYPALLAQTPVLKLDHANVAVRDLAGTRQILHELGFRIKTGRSHGNTIRNFHLKFPDHSSLEWITASRPQDSLAAWYCRFLEKDPPAKGAFFCLRADSPAQLARLQEILQDRGVDSRILRWPYAHLLGFDEVSPLHRLFMIAYHQPQSDPDSLLSHPNSAYSLQAVWLNEDAGRAIANSLFPDLGVEAREISLPDSLGTARVVSLQRGDLYLCRNVPAPGRIAGVTILVRDLTFLKSRLAKMGLFQGPPKKSPGGESLVLSPETGLGLWLEFRRPNTAPSGL